MELSSTLADQAEARLEHLIARDADVGPAWQGMVGAMRDEAGALAVQSIALATQHAVDGAALDALSERFEALADRVSGVGMDDIGASIAQAGRGLAAGDTNSLVQASESALRATQDLRATQAAATLFDPAQPIATGEASLLAQASPSAPEEGYGYGYKHNELLNAIDRFREGAGLPSLREASVLFRDLDQIAGELGAAWAAANSPDHAVDAQAALGDALRDVGVAGDQLRAAQELPAGDAASIAIERAQATFERAERDLGAALDAVAERLGVEGVQQEVPGASVAEATMTQFIEAGGVVTPELAREAQEMESLAGLTVRELRGADLAALDAPAAADLAAMMDALAAKADSLGLPEMADGLRDAAAATAEGPQNADMAAVQAFLGDVASESTQLREATDAFSFGRGEFTNGGALDLPAAGPAHSDVGAGLDSPGTATPAEAESLASENERAMERG